MNRRLFRSRDERIIFGVAGGLSEYVHIDPSLVRILWVVVAFVTFGVAIILYVVMALIVPEAPEGYDDDSERPPASEPATGAASFVDGRGAAGAASTTSSDAPANAPTARPSSGPMGTESIPVAPRPAPRATGGPGGTGGSGPAPSPSSGWSAGSSRADARQARHEARQARRAARRDGNGAVILGVILLLVGGFFAVRTYFPAVDVDQLWPIIAIAIGIVLIVGSFRRGAGTPPPPGPAAAGPGAPSASPATPAAAGPGAPSDSPAAPPPTPPGAPPAAPPPGPPA